MFQKITIMCIVVFSLLAGVTPQGCFADAVEVLEQANTYRNTGWRQQAQQSYETVVTDYPGSSYALKAQGELVILDISEKQDSQIQAAIDSMIANYSEHSDLPAVLCNIAASYGWLEKFDKATSLYQQVIQQWPASSAVAKAELGIARINIVSLIKNGDYTAAAAETDKMLEDFSGQEYLPAALYQIARAYQWSREYELAKSVHQEIIQRFPASSEAERARLDAARIKALALIKAGEYAAAETETSKLMEEFSGQLSLAVVVYSIASEYEGKGKYEKAASLHQQIIQQWPDHSYVEKARFDFSRTTVLSVIQAGDYTSAATRLDKFTTEFGQNRDFTKAMFTISEQYYNQSWIEKSRGRDGQAGDCFLNVVTIWETMIKELPASTARPDSCCWTGDSYRQLGEYEKSIECFQKVISDHPDYKFIWHALLTIGRNYESLAEKGVVSESEAEAKIGAAYQQILDSYPDCPAAAYAQSWMNNK